MQLNQKLRSVVTEKEMGTKEQNVGQPKSCVIANPIYDTVFKKLMENERIARFFLGTLLGENIISVNAHPQEFTY
ncbi:MAG: hypothetical protein LBS09_04330, partial [Bacteroidales bacterium]|nr:hypothetical protein [Bacteroidales bacterium]